MEQTKHRSEVLEEAAQWLARVEIGEGRHHRNLTMFPLAHTANGKSLSTAENPIEAPTWPGGEVSGGANAPRYTLLSDAIEKGSAVVEEVSEGGEVPFLGVRNGGVTPILVPEGEVLVGAKQNRVVNLTVLVAGESSFNLPVSCVEQGRWRYMSRHFESLAFAHPSLREKKIRSAQRHRALMGSPISDQGEVWDEVEDHLFQLETPSVTRSMTDAYAASEGRMEDYRGAITLPPQACGFVAARGSKVVGLDLFDAPATMGNLWSRMADAYFIEALRDGEEIEASSRRLARSFFAQVASGLEPAGHQPELGFEMELADGPARDQDGTFAAGRIAGSALWFDGAVCHLSAFSA